MKNQYNYIIKKTNYNSKNLDISKHNAELFSKFLDYELYEIKPKFPYIDADLDWTYNQSRNIIEMKNKSKRPERADKYTHVEKYD